MTLELKIGALRCSQWLAVASLAGACVLTSAATFSVSPVRIYMQPRERATAVTVVNEGDSELVLESELFQWTQKPDGTDALAPTDDVILAPPVLKLAPKSRQVLRLANLKPVPPGEQLTYRMIVREVPEAVPPKPGVQVQVSLAFSLPVFITPPGAKNLLMCGAVRKTADLLVAACENQGTAYAQAVNLSIKDAAGKTILSQDISAGYILPKARREFQLKQPPGAPAIHGPAKVAVTQDDGSVQLFDAVLAE